MGINIFRVRDGDLFREQYIPDGGEVDRDTGNEIRQHISENKELCALRKMVEKIAEMVNLKPKDFSPEFQESKAIIEKCIAEGKEKKERYSGLAEDYVQLEYSILLETPEKKLMKMAEKMGLKGKSKKTIVSELLGLMEASHSDPSVSETKKEK